MSSVDSRTATSRLPRGGLLTAWLGAWLAGRVAADDVLAVVQGSDEPHRVLGLPGEVGEVALARLLGVARRCEPARVRMRIPVPGDPDGLPRPVLESALAAGEAVEIAPLPGPHAATTLVLVPLTDVRGAPGDELVTVSWSVHQHPRPLADGPAAPMRLREAELAVAEAVRDAATVLAARGRTGSLTPEVQAAIRTLRERRSQRLPVPPGSPPDAVRLLATAEALAAVVALSGLDAAAPGPSPAAQLLTSADLPGAAAIARVKVAVRHARRLAYSACAEGSVPALP